jgi:hypothetical protein
VGVSCRDTWGSQGVEGVDVVFLGSSVVWTCRWIPAVWRNTVSFFNPEDGDDMDVTTRPNGVNYADK